MTYFASFTLAMLATVTVSGCGAQHQSTVHKAATVATVVAQQPSGLTVTVTGTSAQIRWHAPSSTAGLTGYLLYFDQEKPIALTAVQTTYTYKGLAPGDDHYVQVVTSANDEQSVPIAKTFSVPFAEPKPSAVVTTKPPAPTATEPVTPVAQVPTPASVETQPAVAPAAPTGLTFSGAVMVANLVSTEAGDPTNGTTCAGWEPSIQLKDGSGSIVALASLSAGTLSGVQHDQDTDQWDCTYTYSFTSQSPSPVFTLLAFIDNDGKQLHAVSTTVSRATLFGGQGPKLGLVDSIF